MAEIPFDDEGHLIEVLDFLGDELDPSILIGGWATVRRVGGEISRDIDLIIASDAVRAKIEATLSELSRSTHLQGTKWRGTFDGVHIDIYLPHQSQLGSELRLRVEELAKHTENLDGSRWQLLTIEAHTISKFAALLDRPDTEKGFKDAREIVRLLEAGVDAETACRILVAATAADTAELPRRISTVFELIGPRAKPTKPQQKLLQNLRREWARAIEAALRDTPRSRPSLV